MGWHSFADTVKIYNKLSGLVTYHNDRGVHRLLALPVADACETVLLQRLAHPLTVAPPLGFECGLAGVPQVKLVEQAMAKDLMVIGGMLTKYMNAQSCLLTSPEEG